MDHLSYVAQIFSAKKNNKARPRDGHIEHVCKILGSYLSKAAWIFGLLCVKMNNIVFFKWLGFSIRSSCSLDFAKYWTYRQAGSSIFCAKISTDMPWSTPKRIVQNAAQFFSPLLGKSLNNIEKLKACHRSIRISLLETARGPRGRWIFFWPCHTLFHWSWGLAWYQTFTLWLDTASGIRWGEKLGVLHEPACIEYRSNPGNVWCIIHIVRPPPSNMSWTIQIIQIFPEKSRSTSRNELDHADVL